MASTNTQELLAEGYTEEQVQYARMLINDGVAEWQIANSLVALKGLELSKADLLVRKLTKEPPKQEISGWRIAWSVLIIMLGLFNCAIGRPGIGVLFLIGGTGRLIAPYLRS